MNPLHEDVTTYLRDTLVHDATDPVQVLDADPGDDVPTCAQVWPTAGVWTPSSRVAAGSNRQAREVCRVVCIAASARAAANLAWDVSMYLDGAKLGGAVVNVTLATGVNEDTTDPTAYRYTATLDVTRVTPKPRKA